MNNKEQTTKLKYKINILKNHFISSAKEQDFFIHQNLENTFYELIGFIHSTLAEHPNRPFTIKSLIYLNRSQNIPETNLIKSLFINYIEILTKLGVLVRYYSPNIWRRVYIFKIKQENQQ